MTTQSSIEIPLDELKEGLILIIDARKRNTLFDSLTDADQYNEARFQIIEGHFYDYTFNDPEFHFAESTKPIVQPHSRLKHTGVIAPNIYVGTLRLQVVHKAENRSLHIELEVQSVKANYRHDYRDMLEFITEQCTDILLQANAPVRQTFETDFTKDSETLYQKFSFIKSILGSDEFAESIHRIVTSPVTQWQEIAEQKDIRRAGRITNTNIRALLRGGSRTPLSQSHQLREHGLNSLPERISSIRKTDSVDTPENRFVKHALETFLKFCADINAKSQPGSPLKRESELLIRDLESQLHHSIFKEISRPHSLKLNSPVLQRKEGYREVLRAWLMFDLAAKLIWRGGEDIYKAGKKDIASLYEYWVFFKLLELFKDLFNIEPKAISELIKTTSDGLHLELKQGKQTALKGLYNSGSRRLKIRFSYNRSFSGKQQYPQAGSWTTTLRPDYTLSIWPEGISEREAEQQELITHIHLDAKYKVANLHDFLPESSDQRLDEEKTENRQGIYKNADLLKMHAYKDAIRRTGGAYVLYPGDESLRQKGFHEIIPGLGAFPVKPSKTDDGINELRSFILEVIEHFTNRNSQREKVSYRTYDIHRNPPSSNNEIKEPLPEAYNENRSLIPDETFVLVGYYQSDEHLQWIKSNKLYNLRLGLIKGSLRLNPQTLGAKYLLLHTKGDKRSGELWRISGDGPKVFSKRDMMKKKYPKEESKIRENYLIYEIEEVLDPEFSRLEWDFKNLKNYPSGRGSALPFTATLSELMKHVTD
ncbi:DUF2357 domain-containing protein [Robertkochia sediminum]|uniref:DUF2357 domain-containing protein n=1 Tax=Robertkochia sediminum TaxID=2785326 RepID=UPI001932AA1A|nr:DUF2357 domain-containing protein [Robertkochia sediminum]MBL7471359.1 DUF2357 domain-containing protein [Robertkochia sediminum]